MSGTLRASVRAGESLTGNLDFYTVTTTDVNILPSTDVNGDATSQNRLDKLVEVISLRGQPVILGSVVRSGSGPFTYSVRFALEHEGAWANVGTNALRDAIAAAGVDFGFTTGNTTVTVATNL